ncbi:MAG TPA: hypothetical protein VJG90_07005 [Candidatus Nanoarchaeia archaeon]|nr:hypothetical protein [Candidatus Nanoarchaeia archaeon]
MEKRYVVGFDPVFAKQWKKLEKDRLLKSILKKMLDKIERLGLGAGKLLDGSLGLYELKNLHPPIRLYFQYKQLVDTFVVLEFEMKTSEDKQKGTIKKLRDKISNS